MKVINYRHTDLLLSLLKLALWNDRRSFEGLAPVSADEWNVAFSLAVRHSVVGTAWAGICRLADDELPPEDILLVWTAKAESVEKASRRMNAALGAAVDCFTAAGLHPVFMKGQGVARHYDSPMLRECGDIDLCLTAADEFRRSRSLFESVSNTPDGCYRTILSDVEVEVHPYMADIFSPFSQKALRRLQTNGTAVVDDICPRPVAIPVGEFNLHLLSAHIMKHAFGRGVGLRQICDLAMACRAEAAGIDGRTMAANVRRLGMKRWNSLLYAFMVNELGMPREYLPYDVRLTPSHRFAERILYGGNFGNMRAGVSILPGSFDHKLGTAAALLRNFGWSLRCAPMEVIGGFSHLLAGQLRCLSNRNNKQKPHNDDDR